MAISDDAILELAKEVRESNTVAKQTLETLTKHMEDQQAHSGVIPRIGSLERSRGRFRKWAFTILTSGTAGSAVEAKTGSVSKFFSIFWG